MLAPAASSTLADVSLKAERRPLAALADIVEPWRALCERAAEPNVFYDPAFALAAAPVFGRDVEAILVWDAADRLIGFFPFSVAARRYGIRLPLILGWTHHFAPLGTPLVDRDFRDEAITAFFAHITRDKALPKLLLLPLLNERGPVAAALPAASIRCAAFDRHQRALLAPTGDRASYLENAISAKRRKELRRQRHRLADGGSVVFSVARDPNEIAAALDDFLALEAGGWKGRAGTAITQDPDIRRFVETAVTALANRGSAQIAQLMRGTQPIASAITLSSGRGAWGWKIAYDESFAAASPGVQLYFDLTTTLLADPAISFVDSCATPDHPMIDHLWRERLSLGDWLIGLTPDAPFDRACRLETMRRRAIALMRNARDAVSRSLRRQ
jgi:CelD/BcsL family acetyltransferase involved in cellulose biosynthesis